MIKRPQGFTDRYSFFSKPHDFKYSQQSHNASTSKHPALTKINIESNQRQKNNIKLSMMPIGLRNIGNTCFLNSFMQFLYAAEQIRKHLVQKYGCQKSMQDAKCSKLLGKLFFYLQQQSKQQNAINQILSFIAKDFQQLNIEQRKYFQVNALQQTLLNILQKIWQKHPNLIEMFDVEYNAKCGCGQYVTKERILSLDQNICATCKSTIKKNITNQPKYIIYYNPTDKINHMQRLQNIQANKTIAYLLKAEIINIGDGRFGHYIARRYCQNGDYQFNDQKVTNLEFTTKNQYKNGLILLYQLKPKTLQIRKQIKTKIEGQQKNETKIKNPSNSKILQNKIYLIKLFVLKSMQTKPQLFQKRQCFIKIQKSNQFVMKLLNKINFPYYKQNSNFHDFFVKNVTCKDNNQLQQIRKFLQKQLDQCIRQNYESRKQQFSKDNLLSKNIKFNFDVYEEYQAKQSTFDQSISKRIHKKGVGLISKKQIIPNNLINYKALNQDSSYSLK